MISDEKMDDLPIDPEMAFVKVEQILRKSVERVEFNARNNDFDPDEARHEYMIKTLAAARGYKIEALADLEPPPTSPRPDRMYHFANIKKC